MSGGKSKLIFKSWVPIKPQARKEPVWSKFTGIPHPHPKTKSFKSQLQFHLSRCSDKPVPIYDKPVRVHIYISIKKPASVGEEEVWASRHDQGDIDNHSKSILDAMNGIILKDDCLVCRLQVTKRYATDKVPEGVAIKVFAL